MNHDIPVARIHSAEEAIAPKFRRIRSGAMVGGVCNGISRYFGIDVTLVRMAFVVLACISGTAVVVYLTMAFIVPADEEAEHAFDVPSLVEQVRRSAVEVLRATISFDRERLQRCWDEQIAKFRGIWERC